MFKSLLRSRLEIPKYCSVVASVHINLTDSRLTWKSGLWASLWGIILTVLIDVERHLNCR